MQTFAPTADTDVQVDYFVSEDSEVCVMHDRPFSQPLSWVEYDVAGSRLELVLEDGVIRKYGVPVTPELKPYFLNTQTIHVIELNLEEQRAENAVELPLIIQQA